jgi:hypothetical protein
LGTTTIQRAAHLGPYQEKAEIRLKRARTPKDFDKKM